MTQLNQIVAIEKGVKSKAKNNFTQAHRTLETKNAQMSGIARTYRPTDDNGDSLPSESTKVQVNAMNVIELVEAELTRLFDVTLTKDVANGQAKADITVDGFTIATGVPVTTLLFLEKELVDIYTFVSKLPTLDPAETWVWDSNSAAYATPPTQTVKTKKVPRNHVKWAPPSPEFTQPAQVDVFTEDVVVGYWTTIKFSGALPKEVVVKYTERVVKLQEAVKFARESANGRTVIDQKIGEAIFGYIFE